MLQVPNLPPPSTPPGPEASPGNRRKGLAWTLLPAQSYLLRCSLHIMLKV